MRLLSLGHAAYLLEMAPAGGGAPVRILADPWLSDYLCGDLLGRFPRIRFDAHGLLPLHAIYLSHSHTDHLDPYSLVKLWAELEPHPVILAPESLRHLGTLLEKELEGAELMFLRDEEPLPFHGVTLKAFFNPETRPTNEDDVMVLSVENGREVFLCESDALLPFYDPATRESLAALYEGAESGCFLSVKNEGEATMAMLSASDSDDRNARLSKAVESSYEEIYETYGGSDELDQDLWQNPRLVRLMGGQGICFPQALETDWNRVLFPVRLEDRVRMEREVAEQNDLRHQIAEFLPGCFHDIVDGKLVRQRPASFIELLDQEEDRRFDPKLELFDTFRVAPLCNETRDHASQKRRILETLNQRFLPHLIGARRPPVEHLLAAHGGEYRIRVRLGVADAHEDVDFRMDFAALRFSETEATGEPQEHYWANDLDDFLDGRCDEFSTFSRHPLPAQAQRFWLSLGLPFLNNDLIEKKLRFHFERARKGESLEDWVLSFYKQS